MSAVVCSIQGRLSVFARVWIHFSSFCIRLRTAVCVFVVLLYRYFVISTSISIHRHPTQPSSVSSTANISQWIFYGLLQHWQTQSVDAASILDCIRLLGSEFEHNKQTRAKRGGQSPPPDW